MTMSFESSLDDREPMFYAMPQPAMPPKDYQVTGEGRAVATPLLDVSRTRAVVPRHLRERGSCRLVYSPRTRFSLLPSWRGCRRIDGELRKNAKQEEVGKADQRPYRGAQLDERARWETSV
jgi:hypothetical protein